MTPSPLGVVVAALLLVTGAISLLSERRVIGDPHARVGATYRGAGWVCVLLGTTLALLNWPT